MDLHEAIARRQMTRSFRRDPIPPAVLERVLEAALHAPSAGFTQGVDLLCLEGEEERDRFWALASEAEWRSREPRLLEAPVIVLPLAEPARYVARYGEDDKLSSSLAGLAAEEWPVPYWLVDAAFSTMLVLLAATDAGLGALFFRLHGDEARLLSGLGVPDGHRLIGAIALGFPGGDEVSASPSRRPRRPPADLIHRERW